VLFLLSTLFKLIVLPEEILRKMALPHLRAVFGRIFAFLNYAESIPCLFRRQRSIQCLGDKTRIPDEPKPANERIYTRSQGTSVRPGPSHGSKIF
jgi:hypothetical protein